MINGIQGVSFNGIYDFVFPKGTSKEDILEKVDTTKEALAKSLNLKNPKNLGIMIAPTGENRMRVITSFDNPSLIIEIFRQIGGEELAKRYINKNLQEYHINLQA